MRAIVERDISRFLPRVESFLVERRMENTLLPSVLHFWMTGESPSQERIGAYVTDDDDAVVGIAVNMLGWRLVLSTMPIDAVERLEEALAKVDPDVPYVTGPPQVAESFAERRAARLGCSYRPGKSNGMFVASDLPVPAVAGTVRPVSEGDLPLLTRWMCELHEDEWRAADRARHMLVHGAGFLWEVDGEPVALCGYSGPFLGVAHIGPMITVPECRKGGYGKAIWSTTYRAALDSGAEVVTTWVDLDYLPSNRMLTNAGAELVDTRLNYILSTGV